MFYLRKRYNFILDFLNSVALRKIWQNTGFLWLAFSRTEPKILSLYGEMRVEGDPLSGIFYAV